VDVKAWPMGRRDREAAVGLRVAIGAGGDMRGGCSEVDAGASRLRFGCP